MNSIDESIRDLARDGYRIETMTDETVVASKKTSGVGTHLLFAFILGVGLLIALGFASAIFGGRPTPLGVIVGLVIIIGLPAVIIWLWVRVASRRVRFLLSVDGDGEVVQERLR